MIMIMIIILVVINCYMVIIAIFVQLSRASSVGIKPLAVPMKRLSMI